MDSELNYQEAKYLPVLYTKDKKGKERFWKIWLIGNTVYRSYGLVDGKKMSPRTKSYQGTNKGKKNETTAEQQAELATKRTWTKQLDKNYAPKCEEGKEMYNVVMNAKASHGGNNRVASTKINKKRGKVSTLPPIQLSIIPMKAKQWVDKKTGKVSESTLKYFDFKKGVYVQWKLDGFRCLAKLQGNEVVLTTNTGKQYPWLTNLRKEIQVFISGDLQGCDALDGELYAHTLEDEKGDVLDKSARFSTIQGICSQGRISPHPLEDQICFFVFDLVDISGKKAQSERFSILESLFKKAGKKTPHIKPVKTQLVYSQQEILEWHTVFSQQDFEGIVIRATSLMYMPKHRASDMRKYKTFPDQEYLVIDAHLNSGVQKEDFVWVCQTTDGKKFKAKPMGTREEKWKWYDNRHSYIGRRLTVRYQELSADGIPRFPIGIKFRESWDM